MSIVAASHRTDRTTCSHSWRDARYAGRLVGGNPVAPYDMKPGRRYVCINCGDKLRAPGADEPASHTASSP